MTPEQPNEDQNETQPQNQMTIDSGIRIATLETLIARSAVKEATMQAALEQLAVENRKLTTTLAEASGQRDMFQARATELATEYEPDAQVIDLETPKPDTAAG